MKTYFYELRETQPEALFQVSKISSANFSRMKNSHKHSHYEIGCVVDRNNKDLLFETYIENYKYMTPNFAFTFIPPNVRHKGTKEKSFYETGHTATYGDQLLTLSTCEYSQKNGRMVIVAVQTYKPIKAAKEGE